MKVNKKEDFIISSPLFYFLYKNKNINYWLYTQPRYFLNLYL